MKESIYKDLGAIKKEYDRGQNIIQHLRNQYGDDIDREESIKISYDFQAGTYTEIFDEFSDRKITYCKEVVEKIEKLDPVQSFMLVGVGEAITLANVVSRMKIQPQHVFGFDISWSRVFHGKKFLKRFDLEQAKLCSGNLFFTPFQDNSIELVMSNHSLEPNGGKEKEALKELFRVSSKYIVMNEPSYLFADDKARDRIEKHGYVKNLHEHAEELGYEVVVHEKFEHPISKENPTGYILIEKKGETRSESDGFYACPHTKTPLIEKDGSYFSPQSMLSYPIIDGIPCLNPENAILTSARNS